MIAGGVVQWCQW